MSYQVLARKWRPRTFPQLVGQEHIVRALTNALDRNCLHHAFLFTGTRGVGKTTLARLLAKCINCEQGVSSAPCGRCAACTEIDAGRFVDLIEVDAATRTGVDDTRELLENVHYTPSRGRYKVYLIDEVHMFSKNSFNALLKTLEEPPPHIKFLLATTDPQKLPATVLSRCLQFNLKRLTPSVITAQLRHILEQEGADHEPKALALLAQAADGSMRDALSLLDQALAYGGGRVLTEDTRAMLGMIEQDHVYALIHAVADGDAAALLERIRCLAEKAPDYSAVFADMATLLQRVALAQVVSDLDADDAIDPEQVSALAARLSKEDVQLYYQIAVTGRRDLALAPNARIGFEMGLLRMLVFRPLQVEALPVSADRPLRLSTAVKRADLPADRLMEKHAEHTPAAEEAAVHNEAGTNAAIDTQEADDWATVIAGLRLRGAVQQLAAHCILTKHENDMLYLTIDSAHAHLLTPNLEQRLQQALRSHYQQKNLRVVLSQGTQITETPAQQLSRKTALRLQTAQQALHEDPNIQALQHVFNAKICPESVRPID